MSEKKKKSIPAEKIALYEKLVAALPGVERKGADNPYTSLNGNMFSLLCESRRTTGASASKRRTRAVPQESTRRGCLKPTEPL